jgi:hypothetical protein
MEIKNKIKNKKSIILFIQEKIEIIKDRMMLMSLTQLK